jgi:hypothetical protein
MCTQRKYTIKKLQENKTTFILPVNVSQSTKKCCKIFFFFNCKISERDKFTEVTKFRVIVLRVHFDVYILNIPTVIIFTFITS